MALRQGIILRLVAGGLSSGLVRGRPKRVETGCGSDSIQVPNQSIPSTNEPAQTSKAWEGDRLSCRLVQPRSRGCGGGPSHASAAARSGYDLQRTRDDRLGKLQGRRPLARRRGHRLEGQGPHLLPRQRRKAARRQRTSRLPSTSPDSGQDRSRANRHGMTTDDSRRCTTAAFGTKRSSSAQRDGRRSLTSITHRDVRIRSRAPRGPERRQR